MIEATGSNFFISGVAPARQSAPVQQAAPVEDASEAALEQFLESWASGTPGSDKLTLDQMLSIQKATNPEIPEPVAPQPAVQNPTDHALRAIESLVRNNRQIFQNHNAPVSMTDGWNIAGQR